MKEVSCCLFNWLSGEQVDASTEPGVISKECLGFTISEGPSPEGEPQTPYTGYVIYKMQWKKPEIVSPFLHTRKGSGICQEPAVAMAGNRSLLHLETRCAGTMRQGKREGVNIHIHPQSLSCSLLQSSITAAISGPPCLRSSPSSLLCDTGFSKRELRQRRHVPWLQQSLWRDRSIVWKCRAPSFCLLVQVVAALD